jgi:hypothetical protein
MSALDCLPHDTLLGYWSGHLETSASEMVEEHLFSCPACTARSAGIAAIVNALRTAIPPVLSSERLGQLVRAGARVRTTDVPPGATVTVEFSSGVDLLVHRLQADLSAARQVDCQILKADGTALLLLEHVPFDSDQGAVLIACQRHYAPMGPDILFRVTAHEAAGARQVGEYTVVHVYDP